MIRLKVYHQGNEVLVAACDDDLLGRIFEDGELHLEVRREFYDGMAVNPEEFLRHLRLATIGNLVGEETIRVAREAGFIEENGILRIGGVPHAQLVVI